MTIELQPYQQRVVEELIELSGKIQKLRKFIESGDAFKSLAVHEQDLLRRQDVAMDEYASILAERINAWYANG